MPKNLYIDSTTQDLVVNQAYNLRFTSTYGEWLSQKLEARLKTLDNALSKINLDAIAVAQSSDGLNISLVIPSESIKDAINAINKEFN